MKKGARWPNCHELAVVIRQAAKVVAEPAVAVVSRRVDDIGVDLIGTDDKDGVPGVSR